MFFLSRDERKYANRSTQAMNEKFFKFQIMKTVEENTQISISSFTFFLNRETAARLRLNTEKM